MDRYEKFESNAARTLPRGALEALWERGLGFDSLSGVAEFTRFLVKS